MLFLEIQHLDRLHQILLLLCHLRQVLELDFLHLHLHQQSIYREQAQEFQQGYLFEPSPAVVLERLLPRYIEMQIYEAVLESAASEQSARMVAMKNATDNAGEIERELTLTYNKLRQEQITKELLDIVGGAAALEE